MNYKIIYKTLAGSQLYGMSTPESDVDIRGVCLEPIDCLIGLQNFEQHELPGEDTVIYGLKKFINLALDCNPNIIELLFAPVTDGMCLYIKQEWFNIRALRNKFLSRHKIARAFSGYAVGQIKRMETHYKWLNSEPPVNPKIEDFGGILKKDGGIQWPNNERQNAYANAQRTYTQYETWKTNRNPKRHDFELKWGYDTKHGSHVIRLYQQGIELLKTGDLILPRPNAKELLEIRDGSMTYEQLLSWAKERDNEILELENSSSLPDRPDFNAIEYEVMGIYRYYLQENMYE